MARVLIVSGGWDGHRPHEVAELISNELTNQNHSVKCSDSLDDFQNAGEYDLVIPNWTMGEITLDQVTPLLMAVKNGCGVAGIHGGMGDAFRACTEYQFMVGGQFVAHPGLGDRRYRVDCIAAPLTKGIGSFEVATEKYYMHIDPNIYVLATTQFEEFNNSIMPVSWTKKWGKGNVFYLSLGHDPEILENAQVKELMVRGLCWAANQESELQGLPLKDVYKNA